MLGWCRQLWEFPLRDLSRRVVRSPWCLFLFADVTPLFLAKDSFFVRTCADVAPILCATKALLGAAKVVFIFATAFLGQATTACFLRCFGFFRDGLFRPCDDLVFFVCHRFSGKQTTRKELSFVCVKFFLLFP